MGLLVYLLFCADLLGRVRGGIFSSSTGIRTRVGLGPTHPGNLYPNATLILIRKKKHPASQCIEIRNDIILFASAYAPSGGDSSRSNNAVGIINEN